MNVRIFAGPLLAQRLYIYYDYFYAAGGSACDSVNAPKNKRIYTAGYLFEARGPACESVDASKNKRILALRYSYFKLVGRLVTP